MKFPETPDEVRCILLKLVDLGLFSNHENGSYVPLDEQTLRLAVEEFIRAIEGAWVGESVPSACERLIGALFVRSIEYAVTNGLLDTNLVTIEET